MLRNLHKCIGYKVLKYSLSLRESESVWKINWDNILLSSDDTHLVLVYFTVCDSLMFFVLITWIEDTLFMKISYAILRATVPNRGMFVLILNCLFWNLTWFCIILYFFEQFKIFCKIHEKTDAVVCTQPIKAGKYHRLQSFITQIWYSLISSVGSTCGDTLDMILI